LRAAVLDRKNYLFAGSDAGSERSAAIYGLTGTAKLNSLNPEAYLREVLSRISDYPINRIEDLTALEPRRRARSKFTSRRIPNNSSS